MSDLYEIKAPTDTTMGPPSDGIKKVDIQPPAVSAPAPVEQVAAPAIQPPTSIKGAVATGMPEPAPLTNEIGGDVRASVKGTVTANSIFLDPNSKLIASLAAASERPEEVLSAYESAKALQDAYPSASVLEIMSNIDGYTKDYYGDSRPNKTNAKAIWDSVHAGTKMVELGMAGSAAMMKAWGGQSAQDDAKVKDITRQIAELSIDNVPRSWWVDGLKTLGNMAPYTAYFMGSTALASVIGNAAGGAANAAGLTKLALMIPQAIKGLNAAQSASVMAGIDYSEMISNGIDPRTASSIAPWTGIVNTLIEQYAGIGLEGGIQTAMQRKLSDELSTKLSARILASGASKAVAKTVAEFAGKQALGEGVEEALQSLSSGLGKMISETMAEDQGAIGQHTDLETIAQDMGTSFVTALWTSGILGVPATIGVHIKTVKDAESLQATARLATKEQFVSTAPEMEQFSSVPKDKIADVASQVWEATQEKLAISDEEVKENAKAKQVDGQAEEERLDTGALNIDSTSDSDEDGNSIITYTAHGVENAQDVYADVTVKLTDTTVTLEDATFPEMHSGLADEMIQEIAARFPGKQVLLSENNTNSQIEGAYERAIAENPNGVEAGAQWALAGDSRENAQAKNRLRAMLPGEEFASPGIKEGIVAAVDFISQGNFAGFMKGLTIEKDPELAGQGKAGALVSGLDEITGHIKYVMKLAENATAPVVVHELIHFAAEKSADTPEMRNILTAYGSTDGVWTTELKERLVDDTMKLIETNQVSDERARPFLSRVAGYLTKLWKGALSKVEMNPKVASALNAWLSSGKAWESNTKVAEETNTEGAETAPITEEEKADPEHEARSKGAEKSVKFLENLITKIEADIADGKIERYLVASSLSVANDKLARIKRGEWRTDLQLKAEAQLDAGLPLTEEMEAVLETATQMAEIGGDDGADRATNTLFMGQDQLKLGVNRAREKVAKNMADYATLDEWIEANFKSPEHLTKEEKRDLQGLFDYAHRGSPRKYDVGAFAKTLRQKEDIEVFMDKLHSGIWGQDRQRARRIKDAIAKTPVIQRMLDRMVAGKKLVEQDYIDLNMFIKQNEAAVKFLAARLEGDLDMGYEAITDMKYVPAVLKRTVVSKPGISLAEQKKLLDSFTSLELKEKVKSRKFTLADLEEYVKTKTSTLDQKMREEGAEGRDYKEQVRERDALRRLRIEMKKLKTFIMTPVPGNVRHREAQLINFIQQYLQSQKKDPILLAREVKALASVVFQRDPELVDDMIAQIQAIGTRPFNEWTYTELSAMADWIDHLKKTGKNAKADEILARKLNQKREIANILASMDRSIVPASPGSEEERKRNETLSNEIRRIIDLPNMRIDLVASYLLDGKKKGINTRLLFDEMIIHQRSKLGHIDDRTKSVTEWARAKKIQDHIGRTIAVEGLSGIPGKSSRTHSFTASTLLGAYLLVGENDAVNGRQRRAFIHGILFNQAEKDVLGNDALEDMTQMKADMIIKAAHEFLSADELTMGEMMLAHMNDFNDWMRLASEYADLSGKDLCHEKFYFPIRMSTSIAEGEDDVLDLFSKDSFGKNALNAGFVYDRARYVAPVNCMPIDYDAMRLFYDSIKHQEHLVAFGAYLKKLNGIYGAGRPETAELRQQIQANFGKKTLDIIDKQIEQLAQPGDFMSKDVSEDQFSMLRGGMVVANLAFRATTIGMQAMTSWLPFLAEVGAWDLSKVAGEMIASGHPDVWHKDIEDRSPILKARQLETTVEVLRMASTGGEGLIKKIGTFGMQGLVITDRVEVAIGWEALRRKKVAEGMSEAEARDYADKFVIKTQPTSEDLYKSPMYRNMTFFKRCFLQFTQPMSVIYQNIRYDIPMMVHQGEAGKAIRLAAAYAISGLAVGLTAVARGQGPEDDDRWVQFWIQQMTSQYVGSVPIAGDVLNQFVKSVAIDEPFRPFGDNNLPVLTDAMSGMDAVRKMIATEGPDKEKYLVKSMGFAYTAIGTAAGLPVRASQEYYKAIKKGLGIEE